MGKIVSIFLLALCIVVLLFIAALPTVLSSSWGQERLVAMINQRIPGKVAIREIAIGWLGPQVVKGAELADPDGATILSLESLTADASFFDALWNLSTSGTISFEGFNARLISDDRGNTNLMRALNSHCCAPEKLTGPSPVIVIVKNVHGALDLSDRSSLVTVKVTGETEQGELNGKFHVDAELRGQTLNELLHLDKDFAKILHANPDVDLKIHVDASNFPVEILDQIAALKNPKLAGIVTSLLGKQLNLSINQKTIPEGLLLSLDVLSPTLSINADVSVAEQISLSKPAVLALQLTPQLVDDLCEAANLVVRWHLAAPTTAHLAIDKFSIPVQSPSIDTIALNSIIEIDEANFTNDTGVTNFTLKQISGTIAAEANSPTAVIKLTGQGVSNQQPVRVNLGIVAEKMLIWKDLTTSSLKGITIDGEITGIPLSLLDQHLEMNGVLSEWIGTKGDLLFSLQEESGVPIASVQFKSERLELPKFTLWIDKEVSLQQPAVMVLKLPPSAVNMALQSIQPRVQNPVTAQLVVKSFSIPAASIKNFVAAPMTSMYKVDLNAELVLSPIHLISIPSIDTAQLSEFLVRLTTSRHSRPELSATATVLPEGAGRLYDLIGKKGVVNADASFGITLDGKPTINVFNVNLVTDLGRIEMSGEIRDGNRIVLNSPAYASYTLTPASLRTLGISAENYIITQGTPLRLTIDSSLIPLSANELQFLRLTGTLKIDDLEVARRGKKDIPQAVLDKLSAYWSVDGATENIALDFSGITRLGENEGAGKLRGALAINHWIKEGRANFSEAVVLLTTTASNLPTQLVSSLSGGTDLVAIIGDALNIDLAAKGSFDPKSDGTIKLNITSDNLSGSAILLLGDVIRLKDGHPAEFHLKLTPQGYAAIREKIQGYSTGDFVLASPAHATLKLESLSIPSRESALLSAIEGDLFLDRLDGIDMKTQNKMSLSPIKGHISSQNISNHVNFNLSANGGDPKGTPMALSMTGALNNGFTADGSVNTQGLSLNFDASIESMPISMMCEFACVPSKTKSKLEALIGPSLNAKIRANLQRMNGPLYLTLQGKNGNLTLDASLNNGYLQLNQNMTVEVAVTPQLSTHVLNEFIPVVSGVLSSDHPIKLTIEKQGFSVPINDPSEKTVSLGKATLEMGKVRFSGSSPLAKVLSLLSSSSNDQFNVWLTPAYFSLNQGMLKLERVDMLISENYPIAAWGNVDFNRERVNMIIGLSAAAIDKAFGFSNLPSNTFLQIPFRGKLDNPSIDKTKAATRLSALVAQSHGGPQGTVIGTVLDIASGGLTEGTPPPPTTNPLPWAALMKEKAPTENHSSDKKKRSTLDEVTKGASSLLKQILK
ncbi:MAG: hypothetical protein WCF65_04940 [Parachlamydiaceae bacterium]